MLLIARPSEAGGLREAYREVFTACLEMGGILSKCPGSTFEQVVRVPSMTPVDIVLKGMAAVLMKAASIGAATVFIAYTSAAPERRPPERRPPESTDYIVTGTAYAMQSNRLVYREQHTEPDADGVARVRYYTPSGEVFARKTIRKTSRAHQPEFELEDDPYGERVAVRRKGRELLMVSQMRGREKQKTLTPEPSLVIDAGFDSFIKQNWRPLAAGQKIVFDFAPPSRLQTVQLQVQEVRTRSSPLAENAVAARFFMITPTSRLVSMFAGPIHLAYSAKEKRLLSFFGRSNLNNNEGGSWEVRTNYRYSDQRWR